MSAFSDEMVAVALELITEFGETATFGRTVEGTYSTNDGSVGTGTTTSWTGVCCPVNYTAREMERQAILDQDRRLLVNKTTTEPKIGDIVTVSGIVYRVIQVNKEVVNGADIYYDLQVRI